MELFDFTNAGNEFGVKLIEALNSQIISKKVFPFGTVKEKLYASTGWGDMEIRFGATSGSEAAEREVRIRARQFTGFFEVRFMRSVSQEYAPRFYNRAREQERALADMISWLGYGELTQEYTEGAAEYQRWLDGVGEPTPNSVLGLIINAGFRLGDRALLQEIEHATA
jgi:hypothetical protein